MILSGGYLYIRSVEKLARKHFEKIKAKPMGVKLSDSLETFYSYGIGDGISRESGSVLVIQGDIDVIDEWKEKDYPYIIKHVKLKGSEGIVLRYIVNNGEVSLSERYVCRKGIWYLVL